MNEITHHPLSNMKHNYLLTFLCLALTSCGPSLTPNIPESLSHELIGGFENQDKKYLSGTYVVLTRTADACDNQRHFESIDWLENTATHQMTNVCVIYVNDNQLKSSTAFQEIQEKGLVHVEQKEVPSFSEFLKIGGFESIYNKLRMKKTWVQLQGQNNCYEPFKLGE